MNRVYPFPFPNQSPTNEGVTTIELESQERSEKLRVLKEIILRPSADDLDDLRTFLKDKHNLNLVKDQLDCDDLSATHYAAQKGDLEIVQILVQKKFSFNLQQPSTRKTALHVAVEHDNHDIVMYLIGRHEVDMKLGAYYEIPRGDGLKRRCSGNTIMHIAVVREKIELLKEMVRFGKCSDLFQIRNELDLTPLELALCMRNETIFEIFKQNAGQKCIPTSFNRFGDPVLHWAFKTLSLDFLKKIGILRLRSEDVILLNRHGQTLLNNLILLGKQDVIEYIISSLEPNLQFKFVNIPNAKGVTGLILAISKEDKNLVALLIENNADINAKVSSENFEMTPLMVACKLNEKGHIVSLLVDKNADVNAANNLGKTALHIVADAKSSHVKKKAKAILKRGSVNLEKATFDKKYTPIFSAAVHGNVDLFTKLSRETTANVEHCNYIGQTVLHVLVMKSEIELCKELLKRFERNLGKQDLIFSHTIFHIAARNFCTEAQMDVFKRYVKSANRDVLNLQDVSGQTALHKATVARNKEAIDILISAGANTSIKDNVGQTILHLAVLANDTGLFKFLLDKNCDIVRSNKLKQTVLHLAAIVGNQGIVQIILRREEANALISKCHLNGRTALHYAVEGAEASTEIVKILLKEGIDDSLIDHVGDSALDIAKRNPNTEIFHVLRETKHGFVHVFSREIQLNSETIKPAVENLLSTGKKIQSPNRNYDVSTVDSSMEFQLGDSEFKFARTSNNNDELLYEEIMKQTSVDGLNPLHLAAKDGHEQDMRAFLSPLEENHSDSIKTFLSMADLSGNTPVHWALLNYRVDWKTTDREFRFLTDYFIKVGCDFNIPNNQNQTAMHLAAALGKHRLFCELLDAGGNPKVPDSNGLNCLHIACKNGHVMIVKELIGRGVNLNAFTYDNNSPLHICALYNSSEAAECLLRAGADQTCVNNSDQTPEQIAIELSNTSFIRVIWQLNADLKAYLGPETSVTSRFVYQGQIKHDNIKEKFPSIVAHYPKLAETLLDFYLIPLAKDQKHIDEMKVVIDLDLFNTSKVEQNPLISMVFNKRSNLLNHPVTKTYLRHNWRQLARWFFYIMAAVYILAALSFTIYLILVKEKKWKKGGQPSMLISTMVLCLISLCVEGMVRYQAHRTKIENAYNWFQLVYFAFAIAWLIAEFIQSFITKDAVNEFRWFRNTLFLLSLWIIVGVHMRQSPAFGIYAVMMGKITATFLALLVPLSFFVIGPVFCLYIVNSVGSEFTFTNLYLTVTGKFDDEEYKDNLDGWLLGLQAFIELFWMFIVTIVLMSLITGAAVGDVQAAEANSNETNLELAANLIIQTEFWRMLVQGRLVQLFQFTARKLEPQTWDLNESQAWHSRISQMLWGKGGISQSAIVDQIKRFYLPKYNLNLVDDKEDEFIDTTDTSSKTVAPPAQDLKSKAMIENVIQMFKTHQNNSTNQNSQNNQDNENTESIHFSTSSQRRDSNAFNATNVQKLRLFFEGRK